MSSSELRACASKFCRIGLFGKLQQLMQSEKERDVDFLKKLQTGSNKTSKASNFNLFIFRNGMLTHGSENDA